MTRYAIYARYSSDRQSDTSIEDQVRICRERAADGRITAVYTDHAISGGHMLNRPELLKMVDAAKSGQFDVVLTEALDRLSRDQEDIAALFKRLKFAGVKIVTLAEGEVNELHIGLKGTMNALHLKDLADKTRRGQRGRVEQGAIPGGITYGYRAVRTFDAKGEPIRGLREIDAEQAAVVQRIFEDYVSGKSARMIAAALNRDRIPSPRGGHWNASTINGSKGRQNGILNNALYAGKIVYNRQTFVKDPETGKRTARPNPESAWIVKEVPELRVIDESLWMAAEQVRRTFDRPPTPHKSRRPKHALSGLVKCPECGGNFTVVGRGKMSCARNKESGTCNNGRAIRIEVMEDIVIDGLKTHLRDPELMKIFAAEFHAEVRRLRAEKLAGLAGTEKRLATVQRQIDAMMKAILDGMYSPAMKDKMSELEAEKAALQADLEGADDPGNIIDIQPNMTELYTRKIESLHAALRDSTARQEAIGLFRSMVDRIVPYAPVSQRGQWRVEVEGSLANLLNFVAQNECREKVVAGAGFVLSPALRPSGFLRYRIGTAGGFSILKPVISNPALRVVPHA